MSYGQKSVSQMSPDEIHAREAQLIGDQIKALNEHPLADGFRVMTPDEVAKAEAEGKITTVQWGTSAEWSWPAGHQIEIIEKRGFISPMIVRGIIFGAAGLIAGAIAGYFHSHY